MPQSKTMRAFRRTAWSYYRDHGRDLPWRTPALKLSRGKLDPYPITVSEIMLQQTQVDRVIPKYGVWLEAFPNWQALADAPTGKILKLWQGLGYNRRALNLKRCAEAVVNEHAGQMPTGTRELLDLPGIGPYTASAIQAFAFNRPIVMIETNIRSVFIDHFFDDVEEVDDKDILPLIEEAIDHENPREWYWALMDYGAHLKKTNPNPSRRSKQHVQQSTFEGSNRQIRGAIVRFVTEAESITQAQLVKRLNDDPRVAENITKLEQEGFLVRQGTRIRVAS